MKLSKLIIGGVRGKKPACQCRKYKRRRFDPWGRKIPAEGHGKPPPVFLPGESPGQRSLAGYSPESCKESQTIETIQHALTCSLTSLEYTLWNFLSLLFHCHSISQRIIFQINSLKKMQLIQKWFEKKFKTSHYLRPQLLYSQLYSTPKLIFISGSAHILPEFFSFITVCLS